MKSHVSIAIIIIVFYSGILCAQGIGAGPTIGYQKATDADAGNLMFGAAIRLKLPSAMGVEGSINYRQEKYGDGLVTVKSYPVMASVLYYPLLNIYGMLGAGWYNTTYKFDRDLLPGVNNKTEQKFGWHLGAGIEVPFPMSPTFTGSIRYVFIDYNIDKLIDIRDVRSNFFIINIGLLIGL
jgi:opacity protein-like surface antigen